MQPRPKHLGVCCTACPGLMGARLNHPMFAQVASADFAGFSTKVKAGVPLVGQEDEYDWRTKEKALFAAALYVRALLARVGREISV